MVVYKTQTRPDHVRDPSRPRRPVIMRMRNTARSCVYTCCHVTARVLMKMTLRRTDSGDTELMRRAEPVAENINTELTVSDVLTYFRKYEDDLKSNCGLAQRQLPAQVYKPKGGDIYFFVPVTDSCKSKCPSLMLYVGQFSVVLSAVYSVDN